MSQLFTSGGQSIGASASASVLPVNIPLEFSGFISLQSKELSRVFSNTTILKHQFFPTQPSLWSNSHTALTIWTFAGKVISLIFSVLPRFCDSFSSKEQKSVNFMAAVIICSDFGAQENKICHCFLFFLIFLR